MQTKKNKKSKSYTTNSFFQKKPASTRLRDLNLFQKAYYHLKNANPSGDSKRKQMRGVQLAQQLVDPRINSIQTVLIALANKIAQIKAGYPIGVSGVNEAKDSCHRYPCEYSNSDYATAWIHYVNCLLNIPMEDSIIETDVYNYIQKPIVDPPDDNETDTISNTSETPETTANAVTTESIIANSNQPQSEEGTDAEAPAIGGNFLTRFLRNFRRNN